MKELDSDAIPQTHEATQETSSTDKSLPPTPSGISDSKELLWLIGCCWGGLALQLMLFQWLKLGRLSPSFTLGQMLTASVWDVFLFCVTALCWFFLLSATSDIARKIGLFLFYGTTLFVSLLSMTEHAFFTISGTMGDKYLLGYITRNLRSHTTILYDHLRQPAALLLLWPIFLIVFPTQLKRWGKLTSWLARSNRMQTRALFVLGGGAALALISLVFVRPLPTMAAPLKDNVIVRILRGARQSPYEREAISLARRQPLLFDTQRLKLEKTPATKKMNVVVIILETMRAEATTPYNPKRDTTPFMAALSKRSLMVEQMYPVVPHTSKALVSILCGIPPRIRMQVSEGKKLGIPGRCMPKLLKPHGYQSAFFTASHLRFEGLRQMAQNMGFQKTFSVENLPKRGFSRTNSFGYEDRILLTPSLRWIAQQRKKNKPFFLSYLTLTAHYEYNTPKHFKRRKYPKESRQFAKYLNAVRYTDLFLKELFDSFKKRGWIDDTLFVLVGDHGEAFGEHKRWQHDNGMWEEIVKIPTFVYNPRLIPKGQRIKGLRQQTDLLPTITALLGLRTTGGSWIGQSLLQPAKDRTLYMSCWYERFCMARRHRDIKYIYSYNRRLMEVYNLSKDPLERINRLAQPPYKEQLIEARQDLLRWKARVNWSYKAPLEKRLATSVLRNVPRVQHKIGLTFGPYLKMIGYNLHTKRALPNQPYEISYVFEVLQKIPRRWRFFVHGSVKGTTDFYNFDYEPLYGVYPTWKWKKGDVIVDRHHLIIPPYLPRGRTFQLLIGLWARGRGRLPIKDAQGNEPFKKMKHRLLFHEHTIGKALPIHHPQTTRPQP